MADGNAYMALLGGQVGFNECSPLWLAQLSMRVFRQRGTAQPSPVLWIFEAEPSIEELVVRLLELQILSRHHELARQRCRATCAGARPACAT